VYDYVRPLRISVKHYHADANEYTVARLAVDQILWGQAQVDGESLFDICDADSAGMHQLHMILTDGTDELCDDLHIDEPIDFVLFIHRAVFHPDTYPLRQGIIDAVCDLFGQSTLVVMWKDTSGLADAELAALGFSRVAGTELIFRNCYLATPFGEANPRGLQSDNFDFDAVPEHEEWVKRAWRDEIE
jgi:hypothetical protein